MRTVLPDGTSLSSFANQVVDGRKLAHLTSDDLKVFGIKSVGHRKKILARVIRKLQEPGNKNVADNRRNALAAALSLLSVL